MSRSVSQRIAKRQSLRKFHSMLVYLLGACIFFLFFLLFIRILCNSLVWRYFAFSSLKTHLCVYTGPMLFFWFLVMYSCCCFCSCGMPANLIFFSVYTFRRKSSRKKNTLLRHFSMHRLPFFSFLSFYSFWLFGPMFKCLFFGMPARTKKKLYRMAWCWFYANNFWSDDLIPCICM